MVSVLTGWKLAQKQRSVKSRLSRDRSRALWARARLVGSIAAATGDALAKRRKLEDLQNRSLASLARRAEQNRVVEAPSERKDMSSQHPAAARLANTARDFAEQELDLREQGNLEFYTIEMTKKRAALQHHPLVRGAVTRFWHMVQCVPDLKDMSRDGSVLSQVFRTYARPLESKSTSRGRNRRNRAGSRIRTLVKDKRNGASQHPLSSKVDEMGAFPATREARDGGSLDVEVSISTDDLKDLMYDLGFCARSDKDMLQLCGESVSICERITMSQFLHFWCSCELTRHLHLDDVELLFRARMVELFKTYDRDGSGEIDRSEFEDLYDDFVQSMLDADGDGRVSEKEILAYEQKIARSRLEGRAETGSNTVATHAKSGTDASLVFPSGTHLGREKQRGGRWIRFRKSDQSEQARLRRAALAATFQVIDPDCSGQISFNEFITWARSHGLMQRKIMEIRTCTEHQYTVLMHKLSRALVPDYKKEDFDSIIADDWKADSRGFPRMTFSTFFLGVFEARRRLNLQIVCSWLRYLGIAFFSRTVFHRFLT
jgi:Ca2+-binding EF-hand superfamily protein